MIEDNANLYNKLIHLLLKYYTSECIDDIPVPSGFDINSKI